MKREWGVFAADMEHPLDVNEVLKFLRKRIRTLPDEAKRISRPAPPPQRPKSDKRSGVWSLHEMMPPPTCAACDESHLTYQCDVLRGQSVAARYALVRKKHLCFNCLSKHHPITKCTSNKTCRECGGQAPHLATQNR